MCADVPAESSRTGLPPGFGERLKEVLETFSDREELENLSGRSWKTLSRWVANETDASWDSIALIASSAGYSLEWLAFNTGPKRRIVDDAEVAEAVAGGWINGELLEEILSKVRRFMVARGKLLTLERYQRLGHDLYNQVARFPTSAERNAALQVLLEREVPAVHADQSAHERAAAARFWKPAEESSK